jgi:hypothetical protein
MFDAIGDEAHGYQKEKDGWNEGEADKGRHQFGSESGPQNFPFPLENQLYEIPNHQKDQQENQDDVNIDQAEDNDIVGDRDSPLDLGELHFNGCEDNNEDGDDPNDDQLIPSSSCLSGKRFLHRLTFFIPPVPHSNGSRQERNKHLKPQIREGMRF